MPFLKLIVCLLLLPLNLSAQKVLNAFSINESISIDGSLNEAVWLTADVASDFTTISPRYGESPKHKTEVKVLYDDAALYVGAKMYDSSVDSIMKQFSQRDEGFGNTDFFEILIDTYGNGNDGLQFIIGATGVQFDATKSNDGNEDISWDAVWFSAVKLNNDGWICEVKIPYSAIRFPKNDNQEWTINFSRKQARNNMRCFWSAIDPTVNGIFTQSGKLINIKNIKPPLRLSLLPYLSAYTIHNKDNDNPANTFSGYTYNGGLDVKYGITDAFTLDMTLVPDFGQVESDDNVVNLSAFEVQFDEKRPFFTEGLDLFKKANIFYTRRIGGRPILHNNVESQVEENESIVSNPQNSQLYNATKVTGRNSNGLGIGLFNAIEGPAYATVKNITTGEERTIKTQSLTNYNVIVFDQNLKNNSSVSIINTNVWRDGKDFYDANVTGIEFDLKDKKQHFNLTGQAAVSVQSFADIDNNIGHKLELGFSKISGNLNYWTNYYEESPNYNPNDLGFLQAANERNFSIGGEYSIYKPFWDFNRGNFWLDVNYSRIIDPNAFTSLHFNSGWWVESKSFWEFNMWMNYRPDSYDFFEPRTPGRKVRTPDYYNGGIWIGSDGRKKLWISGSAFIYNVAEEERWGYEFELNPRYRFSDKISLYIDSEFNQQLDDTGFVTQENGKIYFGQRDRTIIENFLGFDYNFSSTMGLNMRVRHYWDRAIYQSYYELGIEGDLLATDFITDTDYVTSFFNVDLNFNWRFSPGSDLFINWKNSIQGEEFSNAHDNHYFKSFKKFSQYPQSNSLSVRLVYYIDYISLSKL